MKRGRVSRLNGLWDLCCSSAALDPKMLLELAQNGFVVNQCYGMTETFGDGILNFTQVEKHMSAVGKPDDHVQYKLDETGEICIKGDCVMLGYYKDPEATAEVIDADGWVHTGDLGMMDEEGFIYFRQRIKRMIVTNGYNVYPSQLENILDGHDYVHLSCVIGVKDPIKIQRVKAFVVLKPGYQPTEACKKELLDYCRKHIAKYAMPSDIEFREELPKTLVGKVAYRVLEEEEINRLNGEKKNEA